MEQEQEGVLKVGKCSVFRVCEWAMPFDIGRGLDGWDEMGEG